VLNLPMVLSQEEVARLIDSALTPLHRILLMILYSTGMRRSELTRWKITDVNSQRMVIHLRGGKGRKRPRRHAQPGTSRSLARILAWAEAQTI
jgi:site-specific recombinase XerD